MINLSRVCFVDLSIRFEFQPDMIVERKKNFGHQSSHLSSRHQSYSFLSISYKQIDVSVFNVLNFGGKKEKNCSPHSHY